MVTGTARDRGGESEGPTFGQRNDALFEIGQILFDADAQEGGDGRAVGVGHRFEAFVNVVRETDGEVVTFFGTFGFGGGGGHKRCVGERGEREQLSVGLSKKMFKNLSNHPNP